MKKLILPALIVLFFSIAISTSNASATNLLKNGNFENIIETNKASIWVIDAWKGTSTLGITDKKAHSGKFSAFIQSDEENDARLIQSIKVSPNTIYKLSGYVSTQNIPDNLVGANLCVMGGFGHSIDIKGDSDWRPIEYIFKTANDQNLQTIGARLGFFGSTTVGTVYFDDLVLEKETNQAASVPQLDNNAASFRITTQNEKLTVKVPTIQTITIQQKATAQATKLLSYPTLIILFYGLLLALIINFNKRFNLNINFGICFAILATINFLIRLPLFPQAPFSGDLGYFELWSTKMAELGPLNFYANVPTDYPPFALYIFGLVGLAAKMFSTIGIPYAMNSLVKLPAFLFDIGTAWLLFKLFENKNKTMGFVLSTIYMFLPAIIYNSSYWGQADSFYTFFLILAFYFIRKKQFEFASCSLIVSLLTKTQAIAIIPLFIFYLLLNCNLKRFAKIGVISASLFFAIFIPFAIKMPFNWIYTFYTKQAGDFPYATLNSGNLMMLLNGNFVSDSIKIIGPINYHQLGVFLFLASIAWACWFYFKKRTDQSLAVGFAFCCLAFFMFFPRVHERYLFPVFAFLLISIGYYKERKLLYATGITSLAFLFNLNAVILKYQNLLVEPIFSRILYISAIVNMAFFGYLVFWMYTRLIKKGSELRTFLRTYKTKLHESIISKLEQKPFKLIQRDYLAIAAIALVYCIFIFFNLGSTYASLNSITDPQKYNLEYKSIQNPSYMTSAYFDEIYHGRTAYEFIKGYPIYETTHPPLGKDILSVGILMFGMNPFGMRFMHALAGLLLIITLFFFGREALATRVGAYAVMLLGVLDFMPFVQSRYASIDTFSVLFITLMFLFTFRYLRSKLTSQAFFIILFFALGVAVKWTAIYGFAGALLCLCLANRRVNLVGYKQVLKFAVIFILIAPLIYYLSYLPILKIGKTPAFSPASVQLVIKSQGDMYDYHSKLKAGHPFSSSFWGWPFNFKPLWLYPDKFVPVKPGNKVSIVSMGNPLIWLFAAGSFFILIFKLFSIRKLTTMHFAIIGFMSLYLPWVLVSRATFIYHFYPCLPFYYVFAAFILEPLWEMKKEGREFVYIFFALCFLLLILFYPVLCGMEVSQNYINHLHWFPQDWVF